MKIRSIVQALVVPALLTAPLIVSAQAEDELSEVLQAAGRVDAQESEEAQQAQQQRTEPVAMIEEVIVTARRRQESLQDVPQAVDVVTSETIDKLNFRNFEDVQAAVPGLTLSSGNTGYTTAATIRGASFQVESGATPTVEFYLNDAPIQSSFLFQSMFDLGQIEVLRGPQGTLRGRASPSGSITVTTRRPDLTEFGGYTSITRNSLDALNVQAAVNLPLIADTLALRIAGVDDRSDYDGVRSIHSDTEPSLATKAFRTSLRYEPTDTIAANLMYQHLNRDVRAFNHYQSFHLAEPTAPVIDTDVYPEIRPGDRLGIWDASRDTNQEQHAVTAQLEWSVSGQKLSYTGSYIKQDIRALSPQDNADIAQDFEYFQDLHSRFDHKAHELRLSSEERLFGFFDYTVGAFMLDASAPSNIRNPTLVAIRTGPTTVRPATVVYTDIERDGSTEETSFFGNATFHIGERTELSAGLRHIIFKTHDGLVVGGNTLQDADTKETPTIYNLSASYRFSDSIMGYVNHGKSWRNGADAVGVFRPLTPRLQQFTQLDPETSKSYELGLKTDFFERRLRVNASVFRQDFSNYLYRGPAVYFVNLSRSGATPDTFRFVANVDAVINGAELEIAAQPTERFNIIASLSYAKGKMKDGVVACNDFDGDGRPDRNPPAPTVEEIRAAAGGEEVGACVVDDRLAFAPDWSAVLRPEYVMPVGDNLTAFLRGLYTYYPANEQDPNNPYDDVGRYGLLNLYTGLIGGEGRWEVSLFAKNVLETRELLDANNGPAVTGYQELQPPDFQTTRGASIAAPYMNNVRYTPRREVGLNVRYAFGS